MVQFVSQQVVILSTKQCFY